MAMLDDGITRSRQRLMEIKDNIEYKAMLKEIAFKEDRKDQKETEILEVLDQIETSKLRFDLFNPGSRQPPRSFG